VTAATPLTLSLRVTVVEGWRVCELEERANAKVAEVKREALAAAGVDPARAGDYVVKFGGALIADESRSLSELRVPDGAALVVLAAHRRAVR
jgi:hypothetical protein